VVFALAFSYIWYKGFYNDPDYLQNMPDDSESYLEIVRKNAWQSIYSALVFMASFAYLQPYIETVQNIWM
jgi:hypothetical protein